MAMWATVDSSRVRDTTEITAPRAAGLRGPPVRRIPNISRKEPRVPHKIVVVYSGGLDSTVLLYHLRSEGHELRALSADYGQRHKGRELAAAEAVCRRLGIERRVVDLTALVQFFGRNALTDAHVAVPAGE